MELQEKLINIQQKIKVSKSQYCEFGDYWFRSVEDIQSALKPICQEERAVCTCSDELVYIGERYYVKATATLWDLDSSNKIESYAFAREELEKKKIDGSQLTGVASSYARKYALGGLLQLDDNKDSDGLPKDDNKDSDKKKKDEKQEKKTPKQDKPVEQEPKVEVMTLEKAKEITFEVKGVVHKVGECSNEQLFYLRDNMKDEEVLDAVNLVLMDKAKTGNITDENHD